jgi:F-type H+-transporting ATPase subunit a
MFAHLVPIRTPGILIPFIVIIERVRRVIRPLTLAVRLSANIIAGHLLITLLGNQLASFNILAIIVPAELLLVSLEIAVSLIQAYVFSTLMTLYVREVRESHYDSKEKSLFPYSRYKPMTAI